VNPVREDLPFDSDEVVARYAAVRFDAQDAFLLPGGVEDG